MGRRVGWRYIRLKTTAGLRLYEVPLVLREGMPAAEYELGRPKRSAWLVLARTAAQARRVAEGYWGDGQVYEVAEDRRIRQKQLPAAR